VAKYDEKRKKEAVIKEKAHSKQAHGQRFPE